MLEFCLMTTSFRRGFVRVFVNVSSPALSWPERFAPDNPCRPARRRASAALYRYIVVYLCNRRPNKGHGSKQVGGFWENAALSLYAPALPAPPSTIIDATHMARAYQTPSPTIAHLARHWPSHRVVLLPVPWPEACRRLSLGENGSAPAPAGALCLLAHERPTATAVPAPLHSSPALLRTLSPK